MPADVAATLGYAQMDADSFAALLINRPASAGGCAEAFSIPNAATAKAGHLRAAPVADNHRPQQLLWAPCALEPVGSAVSGKKIRVVEVQEQATEEEQDDVVRDFYL